MLAQEAKAKEREHILTHAYGVRAVLAVGVLEHLGYYIYQRGSVKGYNNDVKVTLVTSVEVQTQKRANKLEMK